MWNNSPSFLQDGTRQKGKQNSKLTKAFQLISAKPLHPDVPTCFPPPPYLLFFSFADFPCVLPPIGPLQLLRMSVSGGDKGNAGCTGSIDGKEPSSGNTSLHLQKLGSLMAPPFSSICHTCSRSLPSSFPFLCSSYTAPSTNEQLLEEVIQGMGPPGDLQPERSQWEAPNSLPCP